MYEQRKLLLILSRFGLVKGAAVFCTCLRGIGLQWVDDRGAHIISAATEPIDMANGGLRDSGSELEG